MKKNPLTYEERQRGQRLQSFVMPIAETKGVTTLEQLGDICGGVSKSAVNQWFSSGKIGKKSIELLAKFLNRPIDEIYVVLDGRSLGIKLQEDRYESSLEDDWVEVISQKNYAGAGDGSVQDEYAETNKLKFKRSSFQKKGLNPKNLGIYYSHGDSMEPRIKDGDVLLYNKEDTSPRDDHVFILRWDNLDHVKRLMKLGKDWFISSDNPHDPKWRKPVPVSELDDFEIIGRVRWIAGWID